MTTETVQQLTAENAQLREQPSEPEIASLLEAIRSVPQMAMILRRLCFQRDHLREQLAAARGDYQAWQAAMTGWLSEVEITGETFAHKMRHWVDETKCLRESMTIPMSTPIDDAVLERFGFKNNPTKAKRAIAAEIGFV